MKQGNIYIVREGYIYSPFKIKILEVTDTTYYIHNLDNNSKWRITIADFQGKYRIIEEFEPSIPVIADYGHVTTIKASNKPENVSWDDITKALSGFQVFSLSKNTDNE